MVSRVAVTGAAGMLGSHLVRRLTEEAVVVHGVDLRPVDAPPAGAVHTIADIRDEAAMGAVFTGMDAVVHTAAALPTYRPELIRSVIVDGTRTVMAAAAAADVPRIVHISSTAVYGLPTSVPTTEDHPRAPVDAYSAAKAEAEQIVESYRTPQRLVPILRPKTFLGPGRMGLFAMLFEWAEEGRHFPVLGRGDVRIQMLAMDDLLDGIVAALAVDGPAASETYNLAAAEFGTIREDFQAVLDAAGHGRRVVSVPARPALTVLRGLERIRLSPVYGRLLHKLMADSYVSIAKAEAGLGFRPRLSNRDAVLDTYRWWRANHTGGAARPAGLTSREPWRQGLLSAAKVFF
ncbi:NAD-dependent epimerase/dehydratase family protein [Micromonospora sp. WMMA1998]|uniref:NAD-dependent epimerase/dehydratase family protein n=1 Tax=Micromonospora sp. WMMA1998 TaxID=3015167 RepID=UPI00248C26B3|nr:NAD-dependent epimerase/dehydratase family protein [Micromonospora sp. WMMA1998]WBC14828.1 NAD-dependent epimerase/dehydratase family protein [Micromonospora sp. WMMA1998]